MNFVPFISPLVMAFGASAEVKALPSGVRLVRAIKADAMPGRVIVFADQGRQLVATTAHGMHAWDVATGERRHTWPGSFQAINASADGATLVAMDEKNTVHLFDTTTRKELWQFRFTGVKPARGVWANDTAVLSFSPDGKRMAVGCFQDIEIWELAGRKFSHRFQRDTGYRFGILDFFPDNKRLIVAGFPTYDAQIWDSALQEYSGTVPLYKYARSAKLSPDGSTFAVGIDIFGWGSLYFIQTGVQKGERRLAGAGPVNNVAFSPDGVLVAARRADGLLMLIHVKSLQVVETFSVKKAGVKYSEKPLPFGLAFSPIGALLAADNGDEILLWDLTQCRKKLSQYEVLSSERLEAIWHDLARYLSDDDDPFTDIPPAHHLLAVPDQAVTLLRQKLKPVPSPDRSKLKQLIRDLDSPEFKTREIATKALHRLDWLAKPALSEALQKETRPEAKGRIEAILKGMTSIWSGEHRRQYRAVEILSQIDTEPARQILRELATGAPAAYLTQLAQERLPQIKKKQIEVEK